MPHAGARASTFRTKILSTRRGRAAYRLSASATTICVSTCLTANGTQSPCLRSCDTCAFSCCCSSARPTCSPTTMSTARSVRRPTFGQRLSRLSARWYNTTTTKRGLRRRKREQQSQRCTRFASPSSGDRVQTSHGCAGETASPQMRACSR